MGVIVLYLLFPKHGALAQHDVTLSNKRYLGAKRRTCRRILEDLGHSPSPSFPGVCRGTVPAVYLSQGCAVDFLYGRGLNKGVCKLVATNKYQIGSDPSSVFWSCFVLVHVYCHKISTEISRNKSRGSQPDHTLNLLKDPTTRWRRCPGTHKFGL